MSEGNFGVVNSTIKTIKKGSTSYVKFWKMILNEIDLSKVTKDKFSYNSPS